MSSRANVVGVSAAGQVGPTCNSGAESLTNVPLSRWWKQTNQGYIQFNGLMPSCYKARESQQQN